MGDKPYELNVAEGQPWIYVRIYDPVTKTLALGLSQDAIRELVKQDLCGFLIDVRGTSNLKTTVEDYDIAYYRLQELGFKPHFKSAMVVDPEDRSHDFLETCTVNAGYNWRIFSDANLAGQWLGLT